MINTKNFTKPTYTYVFPSKEKANAFSLELTSRNASVKVQTPIKDNVPQEKRVLVTGTGSLNFDMVLEAQMESIAKEYNGIKFPW